jgi:hypothetical protein
MARTEGSLRLSRSDAERLLIALAVSLAVHLAIFGGYELGKKYGWWQNWHLPAWLHKTAKKNPALTPPVQLPPIDPAIFVDVLNSDPEPPKNTIYYSDKNSHASNPDEDKNLNQPKLDGKQKNSPKIEDVPKFSKLQPSPAPQKEAPPAPEKPPTEAAQPTSPQNLGDVKITKVADKKTEEQKATPPKPRPRTLAEAREQNHLPGRKMQQEGGAHRSFQSNLDVKSTLTGDYDRRIIEAVSQRWQDLLDNQKYAQDRTGQVQVHFRLKYDGTIEDVQILGNNVGDLWGYVCQASIQDSAPFGKWPDEMHNAIGSNFRDITFTFNYY